MKNLKKALIFSMFSSIALNTFAVENKIHNYNAGDSYKVAMQKIKKTNCAEDLQSCRYYAAVEFVAYAQACLYAKEYKFKTPTSKEDISDMKYLLENWKAIEEPAIHKAVLYDKNDFKNKLTQKTADYLIKLPVNDLNIECSRIGFIKDQDNPEEMSEVLKDTKSFNEWYQPLMKARGIKYKNEIDNLTNGGTLQEK